MGHGITGIDLEGAPEFAVESIPVPTVEPHVCQRGVRFTETGIDRQCLLGGMPGLSEGLRDWEHATTRQHHVGITEAIVGSGVVLLLFDRAAEVFDPFLESVRRTLV